jgi:hypothetical protein
VTTAGAVTYHKNGRCSTRHSRRVRYLPDHVPHTNAQATPASSGRTRRRTGTTSRTWRGRARLPERRRQVRDRRDVREGAWLLWVEATTHHVSSAGVEATSSAPSSGSGPGPCPPSGPTMALWHRRVQLRARAQHEPRLAALRRRCHQRVAGSRATTARGDQRGLSTLHNDIAPHDDTDHDNSTYTDHDDVPAHDDHGQPSRRQPSRRP